MRAAFKCSTCLGRFGVGAGIAAFSDTEHDLGFHLLRTRTLPAAAPPPDWAAPATCDALMRRKIGDDFRADTLGNNSTG